MAVDASAGEEANSAAVAAGTNHRMRLLQVGLWARAGEAQTRRGQVEGNTVNSMLPGHQSRVHKKSVLFLVSRSDTPADSVAKVLSTFEAQ